MTATSAPAGEWRGNGTHGTTNSGRRGRWAHAYLGYWWRATPDGPQDVTFCSHVHRSHKAAVRCGTAEARRLNRPAGEPTWVVAGG